MIWGTLSGCAHWMQSTRRDLCSGRYGDIVQAPYTSHPLWVVYGSRKIQTYTEYPTYMQKIAQHSSWTESQLQSTLKDDPLLVSVEPTSTSTGLIFLLATTLSLMTAPLVEPRYLIIPWVMWRLLTPAWRLHDHGEVNRLFDGVSADSFLGKVLHCFRHYDVRLFVETGWFLAINVVTGYIFLMKPYIWKDEQGRILDDGRLQRFMW